MAGYSEEKKQQIWDSIILKIFEGQTLTKSIKDVGIGTRFFYELLKDANFPERGKEYARACEARADKIFDDLLDIVDDGTNDLMVIQKGDASYEIENKEVTSRSKLRYEARRWMLGKMSGKYADALKLQGDAENPIEQKLIVEHITKDLPQIKTTESEE